jgi:acetyltransferase
MDTQFKDPSQNFIDMHPRALDAIFRPKRVALIGAKDDPGSVGRTVLLNLIENSFGGTIYPVNPKREEVCGLKCYPSIGGIPEIIDLAIIVTPSTTVPKLILECVQSKVRSCIVISAGFKELGSEGLKLEEEMVKIARSGRLPIIGPNCLGVMNPLFGLNATFAKGMALPGNVAFISQSGAMCTSVLDWSFQEKIGFSSFVSIGSMADIDFGDLIDYLGSDPETRSILIYMETVGNARKFLSAAREIALEKPIIVIKAGRTLAAAKAAASHTGSLAGSDAIFDAALEQVGVLRVDNISELFQMASVLARQPRPKGPKLAIITNAGGPAVLATDAAILQGADLSKVSEQVMEELNSLLPLAWSHSNPIDILGDAGPERFAKTMAVLAKDEGSDGILAILSPQDMTDPTATAEKMLPFAKMKDKPLIASWMGGLEVSRGIEILNAGGIPAFPFPDDAARAFSLMWRYSKNIQALYQTTNYPSELLDQNQTKQAKKMIAASPKTLLDEFESKQILADYSIPVVETFIAKTKEEAAHYAEKIGYPCVVKLFSKTITHKTDVGGVKLGLKNKESVEAAFHEIEGSVEEKAGKEHFQGVTVQKMIRLEGYELIIGSSVDSGFGPTLLFGTGGQLVEVFKDRALALPPLTMTLARFLIEKTKIYEALKGVRGRAPIDLEELQKILVRFSLMITENPRIKECDINPLLASPDGIIALDARFVLYERDEKELPRLAIRPYPYQYVKKVQLKNGTSLLLRPIRPEDESLIVEFHKELSSHSVRQRYFDFVSLDERVAHERLVRICFNDFDREISLVAEDQGQITGVIRVSRIPRENIAELTMIILDAYHGQGLGTLLLQEALQVAKEEGIDEVRAHILDENSGMLHICKKGGFVIEKTGEPHILLATWKK